MNYLPLLNFVLKLISLSAIVILRFLSFILFFTVLSIFIFELERRRYINFIFRRKFCLSKSADLSQWLVILSSDRKNCENASGRFSLMAVQWATGGLTTTEHCPAGCGASFPGTFPHQHSAWSTRIAFLILRFLLLTGIGILYFTYWPHGSGTLPDKACHSLAPMKRLVARQSAGTRANDLACWDVRDPRVTGSLHSPVSSFYVFWRPFPTFLTVLYTITFVRKWHVLAPNLDLSKSKFSKLFKFWHD